MIVVSYGSDIEKTTYDALAASDIGAYLKPGYRVSLKPNLVVPGPASNGAVTHTEVTEAVIRYLKDFGTRQIKVIESSWVGERTENAYNDCGYKALCAKYGIEFVDLKKDKYTRLQFDGLGMDICNEALETDFLINLPVLKAHCQTRLTCCMKNLKGCIPDSEKRRFHTFGIHRPVAALNALIKTGYCVVDGICGDLSFEEGGNPVTANRIIAGRDPLVVDSYCAKLIGYKPDEIEYLSIAKKMGLGSYFSPEVELIELGAQNKPLHSERCNVRALNAADKYRSLILDKDACSACYSALVYALHRLDAMRRLGAGAAAAAAKGGKIHIGQGFRGEKGAGFGVGLCAKGFDINVAGCPPTAADIIDKLS